MLKRRSSGKKTPDLLLFVDTIYVFLNFRKSSLLSHGKRGQHHFVQSLPHFTIGEAQQVSAVNVGLDGEKAKKK